MKSHETRKRKVLVLEIKTLKIVSTVARRIAHLIEEQEDNVKLFRYQDLNVGSEQVQEQESRAPTPQCEVTMPKEENNHNGKRLTETKLTGKKSRKLMKKKVNLEKLQNVPE
jgi:hypothetical protein